MENPVSKVILRIAHREFVSRYGYPCEETESQEFQVVLHEVLDAVRERWEERGILMKRALIHIRDISVCLLAMLGWAVVALLVAG